MTIELKPGERVEARVIYYLPDGSITYGDWVELPPDNSIEVKKMLVETRTYKFLEGVDGGPA